MSNFEIPTDPPKEVIDFFEQKGYKTSYDWRDMWQEEHQRAFTVAKAMQLDQLTAIRKEVNLAIQEGRTVEQFKRDLTPKLQQLGWWGKQETIDPKTGEKKLAQLGSDRRLRIIYETNLRMAYAAGQWERIACAKKTHPYLLYQVGPVRHEHRPEHLRWHGLLLPVDDPFWLTHMTPNGWLCHCSVRQISNSEYDKLLKAGAIPLQVPEIDPRTNLPTGRFTNATTPVQTTAPKPEYDTWQNPRTGEVFLVSRGIDPGFDYNPGISRSKVVNDKFQQSVQDYLGNPYVELGLRYAVKQGIKKTIIQPIIDRVAIFKKAELPTDDIPLSALDQEKIKDFVAKYTGASAVIDDYTSPDFYKPKPATGNTPSPPPVDLPSEGLDPVLANMLKDMLNDFEDLPVGNIPAVEKILQDHSVLAAELFKNSVTNKVTLTNKAIKQAVNLGWITPDEVTAIKFYSSNGSAIINKTLRNTKKPFFPHSGISDEISHLDSALSKLPKYQGNLRRSMFVRHSEGAKELAQELLGTLKQGIGREFPEFLSTTASQNVGLLFGGIPKKVSDGYYFHFEIKAIGKKGSPIASLSRHPNEYEVLFRKGTEFKLTDVVYDKNNSLYIIRMEEMEGS